MKKNMSKEKICCNEFILQKNFDSEKAVRGSVALRQDKLN